jgi:hypothetical protein
VNLFIQFLLMDDHSAQTPGQQHNEESSPHNMDMGKRGTTRPMMDHSNGHGHMMNTEDRKQMLAMHHRQTLWVYWMIIILGVWTILSPLTFSYHIAVVPPSGGRGLWLSDAQRIAYMKWSDIICGALLIFFGSRSLLPNRPVSLWICCLIGVWMSIAPLLFWAPTAAAYLNDTLVGMLIISLAVLIPGMPNMIMYMKMGSEVPPGWSYNPSSWAQRWIMIVTGFMGFVVSRYLAAFQLGYLDAVWDPFFGASSEQVLNSSMSHSLPISDAGLGSLAYTFEFLMGFMGSPSRWRTMPWMVTFFGILVIPLGLVHIFLVISQPLTVGAWCFFCLMAAGIMLPMIPLEVDEVVAMGQHMVQAKRRGEKFWQVFWKGGKPVEQNKDERSPELMSLNNHFGKVFKASVWGMSVPGTLLFSALIGMALVVLPDQCGIPIQSSYADINHLCGALIVVVSVISMGEVVRTFRLVNILLGLALTALPWFLTDAPAYLKIIDAAAGVIVALLALPRGALKEQYGLWTKYIK